ncbi:MAG: hypothetical protein GY878_05950, partial [Fuerstiella sp.]|nr:hypothetical protein [Fuerstiella sp.]
MPDCPDSSSRSISQFFQSLKHKARQRRLQQRRQRLRRVEHHAPAMELLEDRLMLAAFSEAGQQLDLDLDAANSHVRVQSSASNEYVFTLLSGDTWQGTDTANVTGQGTAVLTVTPAGRSQFNIVSVTDSALGTSVTFAQSTGSSSKTTITSSGDTSAPVGGAEAGPDFVVAKALDGQVNTKYANRGGAGSGLEITPTSGASIVSELKLTTATDLPERDPASYKLEGKTGSGSYALISEGQLSLPTARDSSSTIQFNNTNSHTTYRLTFPALRSSAQSTMQIGEVELLGVSSSSTSASTYADTFNIQLDDAAAGTITFDGTSSFTGSAALSAGTSRNIVVNGRVSTANGALRLSANQQATSTASDFTGIVVSGTVEATGTGAVTLTGRAGSASNAAKMGVKVESGRVSGGTTGTLTINGDGGTGTSSTLHGVGVVNSTITSVGANVDVTGRGAALASASFGIIVIGNSQISAGGSGVVTVMGTGGDTGDDNFGVMARSGGTITSSGGNVNVTGVGGGSGSSSRGRGVFLIDNNSTITAGGSGRILVKGQGGSGTGADNHGVEISGGAKITSSSGALTVQGAAGNKASTGIVLVSTISHTGSGGRVEIATDSINFFGSGAITAGDNTVVMKPLTAGYGISLGPVATGDVTKPGDTISKYPANADDAGPQFDAAKAIDNQTDTKYALRDGAGKGLEVTLAGGAAVVSDLKLTTAADLKDRDPGSYKLEGKTQGGAYKLIKEGTLSLPDARNAAVTIPLGNSVPYATYRLTFPAMRSGSSETTLQIGEVELLRNVTSLELTDGELDKVTAGTLVFGDNTARPITLTENITRASKTNVRISTTETFTPGSFT